MAPVSSPDDPDGHSSRPDTPLASQLSSTNPTASPVIVTPADTPSQGEAQALSRVQSSASQAGHQQSAKTLLLPVPVPSVTKPSRLSFTMPDPSSSVDEKLVLNPLPPELASADISLAPDGSFIETSSGQAARELKRRYDQLYGVCKEVRSPYAITAFINQHGKQMYRLGHRELEAPAAAAAEIEQRLSHSQAQTSPDPSRSPKSKRRSLISMHNLLSHPMFKNNNAAASSSGRPSTGSTIIGPRKLRKTRSIPDMVSTTSQETTSSSSHSGINQPHVVATSPPPTGRAHSQSLTAADIAPFSTLPAASQYQQHHPQTSYFVPLLPRHGDMFSQVMDWVLSPGNSGVSTPSLVLSGASSPTHHLPTSLILHPFGPGVVFDSPSRKPAMEFLPMPRHIREMQSFESNLTARQGEHRSSFLGGVGGSGGIFEVKEEENEEIDRPGSALRINAPTPKPSLPVINTVAVEDQDQGQELESQLSTDSADDTVPTPTSSSPLHSFSNDHSPLLSPASSPYPPSSSPSPTPSLSPSPSPSPIPSPIPPRHKPREIIYAPLPSTLMISRWATDVFDVLQTYRGLPRLDKLLNPDGVWDEMETTVIRMSLAKDQSAAPKDDPRFVIWGELVGPPAGNAGAAGGFGEEERRGSEFGVMSDPGAGVGGASLVGGSGVGGLALGVGGVGAATMTMSSTGSGSAGAGDTATVQSPTTTSPSTRRGLVSMSVSISGKSSTSTGGREKNKDREREREKEKDDREREEKREKEATRHSMSRKRSLRNVGASVKESVAASVRSRSKSKGTDHHQHGHQHGHGQGQLPVPLPLRISTSPLTSSAVNGLNGAAGPSGVNVAGPAVQGGGASGVLSPGANSGPASNASTPTTATGTTALTGVSSSSASTAATSSMSASVGSILPQTAGGAGSSASSSTSHAPQSTSHTIPPARTTAADEHVNPTTDSITNEADSTPPKKVIVAATIERWIAQLTSDLDYDELLNFFLTYRTFVSAVDLCHLLISRFHWALQTRVFVESEEGEDDGVDGDDEIGGKGKSSNRGEDNANANASSKWKIKPGGMENEDMVKRIVRVRTFVAIRYWLVTFFVEDFVPNRELRVLLAEWLNVLSKDPILKIHIDGMGIVKRLIKVAKECKAAHTKSKPKPKGQAATTKNKPPASASPGAPLAGASSVSSASNHDDSTTAPMTLSTTTMGGTARREHLLGEKFAQAVARKAPVDEDDSDLDLDFLPEESASADLMMSEDVVLTANAHLSVVHPGYGGRPTSIPLSSLSILQGAGHAIPGVPAGIVMGGTGDVGHHLPSRTSGPSSASSQVSSPPPPPLAILPVHHNAFSRVLTKAVGRLGRWKRVLNSRAGGRTSLGACVDTSAVEFDELTLARDLLTVNGGVEHYLGLTQYQQQQQQYHQDQNQAQAQAAQSQQVIYQPQPQSQVATGGASLPRQHPHIFGVASPAPIPPPPPPAATGPAAVPAPHPEAIKEDHEEGTPALAASRDGLRPISVASNIDAQSILTDARVSISVESTHSLSDSMPNLGLDHESTLHSNSHSQSLKDPSQSSLAPPFSSRISQITTGASSFRSTSTDSFGAPLPPSRRQWEFDVVSIDDLEFSDTSSLNFTENHSTAAALGGPAQPPGLAGVGGGLRKQPRRLPMRKDFEFIRRPDSVSSLGIISRGSMASHDGDGGDHENRESQGAATPPVALGGGIQQWQMNALIDSLSDDDEPGDVEDALKRLEGQINMQKQQEKVAKVDGWIRSIQRRLAMGDYGDERPRWMDSDDEDEMESILEPMEPTREEDEEEALQVEVTPVQEENGEQDQQVSSAASVVDYPSSQASVPSSPPLPPLPSSPPTKPEVKPPPEPAIPIEILESRVPAQPLPPPAPATSRDQHRLSRSSNFASSPAPNEPHRSIHRSFILSHRAEALARHFAMIDRELFLGVKFDELVSGDWITCKEVEVLDWAQFIRDRLRWKTEGVSLEKTTALAAVRARFNLMANFTLSEVVLTPPQDRPVVVAKFIRIAWKSYCLSSFNTLVAIMTGLQSEWVTRATRRSWNKIGMWEKRMFNDLKAFVSHGEDFWYIKKAVDAIADAKPLEVGSHASVISGGATDSGRAKAPPLPTACIPFIGIYLSQLHRINKLPDLIDPTAPNEAVPLNPLTSAFEPPARPEVFDSLTPLPPTMSLEPLINVHKQRKVAAVVKSLVGGQHLASGVHFELDKRLTQRCLRLRGLPVDTLNRALQMYPE